ncbi:DEKNAAC103193 [Brettanomyces naardenensis]|uniref:DEKNAAC103193 n=1 Tax=Brettanomyces naardenensis TaxID=13370 RepID=A0A448YMJ7_BRENA|nr:DEKNAAC103193 [Brettanomyces naardenensis]
MVAGLRETIRREKAVWKTIHQSDSQLKKLEGTGNEQKAVEMITQIICPIYCAFQERPLYFQTNLNGLLVNNLVPMDMVHSFFLEYFEIVPESLSIRFKKPPKSYRYADISLISAIVYVVDIFTKFGDNPFHYHLTTTSDELSYLALTFLNASQFKRKKTHQALLALIVLTNGLFIFDNFERTGEQLGSYPMFQLCLDLCYQMGLYTDPDTTSIFTLKEKAIIRLLPASKVNQVWNYMQTEDAFFSLKMGTPLLINYDFCEPYSRCSDLFFEMKREQGVLIMRQLSMLANSRKPVSIRDLLDMIHKVLDFCSQIPASMLEPGGFSGDLDELAYWCKQKLILLSSLHFLCRMVIVGITYIQYPADDIAGDMYRQLLISAVTILNHIKYFCEGRSVFSDVKYLVYLKDIFSRTLGQGFITWFTFFLPKSEEEGQGMLQEMPYPKGSNIYSSEIDLCTLERALYHKTAEMDDLSEGIFNRLLSSSELMTFTRSLYDLLCQNEVMKNSLNSFFMIKHVLLWSYVARTLEESPGMSFLDAVKSARRSVENHFLSGRLDEKSFVGDGCQLDQLLDSLFEWTGQDVN